MTNSMQNVKMGCLPCLMDTLGIEQPNFVRKISHKCYKVKQKLWRKVTHARLLKMVSS